MNQRKYKDSGIEWIGIIPEKWKLSLVKYVYQIKKATLPKDLSYIKESGMEIYLSMDIIRGKSEDFIYSKTGDIVEEDDLLLLWDGSNAGEVIFDHPRGYAPSTTAILRNKINLDKDFTVYFMKLLELRLREQTIGMGIPHVDGSYLRSLSFLLPPIDTQKKIGQYLKSKTTSIDTLIQNKEYLVNLLKEKRQAIISEAVTKGLYKNVSMKYSGIEWVGEIPEHWDVVRTKILFQEIDKRNYDESATLLSLFTAIGVKPRNEMEDKGNKSVTVINYKIVQKDDLIVNKLLAWMGAIAFSEYNGVTSPDYDVYRPNPHIKISKDYYHHYFRDTNFKGDCFKYGHGIMMMRWRTYPEEFLTIPILNPPLSEQIEIANFIVQISQKTELVISNLLLQIEKLKEYRQSIISETVTGKVMV